MVRVKSVGMWLISLLLLIITIVGASALEKPGVNLKEVYLDNGLLKIEYEPVYNNSDVVICAVLIDDEVYVDNIISTPNKINRISEPDSFDQGEYLFSIICEQNEVFAESSPYLLKFTDNETITGTDDDGGDDSSSDESFLNNNKEVFFTIVVLVAAIIIIKSLIPKNNKSKNKRLRRFA